MRVERFTAEYDAPHVGGGVATPRLSWTRSGGAAEQTAYELRVRHADGTVRTASVAVRDQVLVPWPFTPLASRERVEAQVRVEAGGEWTPWSEPLAIEAGLLRTEDVVARFVSPREVGGLEDGAVVLGKSVV